MIPGGHGLRRPHSCEVFQVTARCTYRMITFVAWCTNWRAATNLREREPCWSRCSAVSDDVGADAISVSGERLDVGSISGEHRATWFGNRDDECIDG